MTPSRPTLADVAREAGVSLMTVSRVVNHKDGVGAETRAHIESIIERLGYRPSGIARSLVTQRTGTIGLIVPDVSNPFFPDVIRGAEQVAFQQGYSLLLCNTEEDTRRESDLLQLLAEKWVDGILLCSSRQQDSDLVAALAHYPAAVMVNRTLEKTSALAGSVCIDDVAGGRLLTEHLLARGHRAIGFLSGPHNSFSGHKRLEGQRTALAAAALPWNSAWQRPCAPSVEGGRQAAQQLLSENPALTALVCYNDLVAVGALQAAATMGRRVPGELAITGYDDIYLAALVTPALTTCRVQRDELGRWAAQVLLDALNESGRTLQTLLLAPELIVRQST
ncbi:MAG: LacI family DNA-binding transcriptional regulator [Chloroflexota bacterium]